MSKTLLDFQNPDGGWGFKPGARSWTEPTAWALLSMFDGIQNSSESGGAAIAKGLAWLGRARDSSGGWRAAPDINSPSWLASLVCLLPPELLGADIHGSGIASIRASASPLQQWTDRLRNWMLGHKPSSGPEWRGWSWVPGTASWVTPTSLSLLTVKKYAMESGVDRQLIEHAENYLLLRQCGDGGWNHGSSEASGYVALSYPETTGLALLALRGSRSKALDKGLQAAERLALQCQTFEGACWLRLALFVHGRQPIFEPPTERSLDTRQMAMELIAERSINGAQILWRS